MVLVTTSGGARMQESLQRGVGALPHAQPRKFRLHALRRIRRVRSRSIRGATEISAQFNPSTDMIVALQQVLRVWLVARKEKSIGAYWPIKGEFDPLPALYRWSEGGVDGSPRRIGLPVADRETKSLRFQSGDGAAAVGRGIAQRVELGIIAFGDVAALRGVERRRLLAGLAAAVRAGLAVGGQLLTLRGVGGDPECQQCGWVKDKFGLSWQIVPTVLGEMMKDKDRARAKRVMEAMLQMKKLDIAGLERAYDGR